MPGIGGLSVANNLLSNQIQLNLNKNQSALQSVTAHLSTGLRINGPVDDPSGYSLATNLQTQVNSYDQASQNIQVATSATTVATGALNNISAILQQVTSLALESSSSLLSTSDRTNLQTEITQLVGEVNTIAGNTTFNGTNLLNGSVGGYQAAVGASATISQNSPLNSQVGNLVSNATVSTTNAAVVDGTLEFVVAQGATISTQVYYITSAGSAGQLISTISNFGAAATYTLAGVTVSVSAVGTADIGSTSFVKISQYVSSTNYTTAPALSIQTGSAAGDAVTFNIGSVTSSSLRIGNLNVLSSNSGFNVLASQDVIGQVNNALQTVNTLQANIGAAQIRLQQEQDNDNLSSVNLQAAESSVRDLNVAAASTQFTKNQLLINFGNSLLSQANTNANSVLSLFR